MTDVASALWYTAPGTAELRPDTLPDLGSDRIEIVASHSLPSRGTERLVWQGRVPEAEAARMRAPMQEGDFPFPVKYGYALTGRVVAGPEEFLGRRVFALHPHQDRVRIPAASVVAVPEGVPDARATLAANMETALNATWDAALHPGARVAVVGMGLLGCLITALLSRRGDLDVTASDILTERAAVSGDFHVSFRHPDELGGGFDVVFHTTATAKGLSAALNALRFEGEVIELSWYGEGAVGVPLGGAFHSQRLTIRSSQVGHVAPSRRAVVSHRRRLELAMEALADPRLDRLVTGAVHFRDLPTRLKEILGPGAPGIATVVDYR